MKKYFSLALGFAAAATLSVSCQKEEIKNHDSGFSTVSVSVEQPVSKTSLSGVNVLWSAGDKIDVISNGGGKASTAYTLTAGEGTSKGTFTGAHASSLAPFFFAYPLRDGNNKGGGTFNLDIPQIQYYAENSFGPGANPMVGTCQTKDGDLVLHNLFGAVRLALKGTVHITKIELTDNSGAALYGMVKCAIVSGDLNLNYSIDGGGNKVVLNCGDGVTLKADEPTYFHICLPVGALSAGCSLKFFDGVNVINTVTTTNAHTIARSVITPIAPITVVQGEVQETVAIDLSEEGTANCYIVYKEGTYKFKTVQGNTTTALTPASASVVWETVNTTSAPQVGTLVSDVSYKDGYITFSATSVHGNALIAAKDAEGKIVWSWHIWMPESKVETATYSNGKTFMDRNLGALNATPGDVKCIGFLYEWGRKDPFMGMGTYTENTPCASTCPYTKSNTAVTVEEATANPTTYYSDGTDWDSARNISKWSKDNKTVADPCPVGFMVPLNTFWDTTSDSKTAIGALYDANKIGWTVDQKHWYPITGNMYASDCAYHSISGKLGYYWNCISGQNQGQFLYLTATEFTPRKSSNRSQGMAVRCVAQ